LYTQRVDDTVLLPPPQKNNRLHRPLYALKFDADVINDRNVDKHSVHYDYGLWLKREV